MKVCKGKRWGKQCHVFCLQFGTLRRTGGSYLPPDFSDGTLDDNDDMTDALESLAKDIEISKEEEHMPTEAELANLSPVSSLTCALGCHPVMVEPGLRNFFISFKYRCLCIERVSSIKK